MKPKKLKVRQEKYAERMKRYGFVTVRSWVPPERAEDIRALAEMWRRQYEIEQGIER